MRRRGRRQDDPREDGDVPRIPSVRPRSTRSRGTRFDVVHDEQNLLEEGADEDDGELLGVVDADPDDRQRDEADHRHVADEVDQRLDGRLREPIVPMRTPIGMASDGRDQRSRRRSGRTTPTTSSHSVPSVGQLAEAVHDHGRAREEELRRDRPPPRASHSDEQHEERECRRRDVEADGDVAADAERRVTAGPARRRRARLGRGAGSAVTVSRSAGRPRRGRGLVRRARARRPRLRGGVDEVGDHHCLLVDVALHDACVLRRSS